MRLIFQLGTNNWQRDNEPAPGSGILHEMHHRIMNSLPDTKSYSMFPSPTSVSTSDDYRVFKLDHPIPNCESSGPVSSHRWHAMTEAQITEYRVRLESEAFEYMEEVEKKLNTEFNLVIAHHAFLNPLVMRNVIARRIANGKPRTPLACFMHGTGLKMFEHELNGENVVEYPLRFHTMLTEENVFGDVSTGVSVCIANSPTIISMVSRIYPKFPTDRIVVALPGINQEMFTSKKSSLKDVLISLGTPIWPPIAVDCDAYDKSVAFVGKLADVKRVEALLLAAVDYEKSVPKTCTLIVGGGPKEYLEKLIAMADELGLKSTFFYGHRSQEFLVSVNSATSVFVLPTFEEQFGMALVEALACGCPVICTDTGGPSRFVTDAVGGMAHEPGLTGLEELGENLKPIIRRALTEDWRSTKTEACIRLAKRYDVASLTEKMVNDVMTLASCT